MRTEQHAAQLRWMKRPDWLVRLACRAGAACLLGAAAGAQSLFDSGPVSFTDQQAARGRTLYAENCASCHGPHLTDGQFAPPLKGPAFKAHWHEGSPESLMTLIVKRMPPASPGSLGGQSYTDIEAYLLQENGGKAAAAELAASSPPAAAAAHAEAAPTSEHAVPRTVGGTLIDNQDAVYHAAMAARK